MLIGEPPPTQADVHFRVLGFPVRIHPFFWVTTLLLGLRGESDPIETVVWIGVVFVSILVHEMGHATMQRKYGGHPRITLYGLGGLASCSDCDRSPWRQIIISLAGPFAGFLFAAAIILGMRLTNHSIGFVDSQELIPEPIGPFTIYFKPMESWLLTVAIWDLLQVNILWGFINLLPVYPLDGGQIARELFTLGNPRAGVVQSLQLSAGVAVLLAAYAILNQKFFMGLMFGYLAYSSFQTLQAYRNHWR